MDWWNDLTDWISSDTGWRVLSGAVIPFVAIIVAGIVAALIGRGATKRVVSLQERESKNAAVAAIVSAARKAAAWGSLGHDERAYADHLAEDADIRLRLLPVAGAPLAANWAQHEIADIKKNSSTFSFQADQSLADFRDRLLDWQARPGRARKLFKSDLERWKFESPDPDAELIKRQQDWNADQASPARPADTASAPETQASPTPTTTSLRPAQRTGGTPAAASSAPAAPGSAPATGGAAAFSATRNGAPITDDVTRPYSDADVRPTLGAPTVTTSSSDASVSDGPVSAGTDHARDDDNADVVDDVDVSAAQERRDDRPVPPPVVDGTATQSVPARIADGPVEPADANETSEAPYTQPISANELRRRSEDDE